MTSGYRSPKWLVVETDPKRRAHLEQLARENGADPVGVGSGIEACRELSGESFDVAIVQSKLAGVGAAEILDQAGQYNPDTPFYFLVDREDSPSAEQLRKAGAEHFIAGKPESRHFADVREPVGV